MSPICCVLLPATAMLLLAGAAAQTAPPPRFDDMAGAWQLVDDAGRPVGTSTITVQAPGAMLCEERSNREGRRQLMWLANRERGDGWTQIIAGFNGLMRDNLPLSKRGDLPWVMGGTFGLPEGGQATFRLTIAPVGADEFHRQLENSKDGGATWAPVFSQHYHRVTGGAPVVRASGGIPAPTPAGGDALDFAVGEWTIHDPTGRQIGTSTVTSALPGSVLYERRTVNGREQPLWFMNSETAGGWTQLFVAFNGLIREFTPQSKPGEWPMIVGGDFAAQDGKPVRFRLTMTRGEESRRVLESSRDSGGTWSQVFDYTYRPKFAGH